MVGAEVSDTPKGVIERPEQIRTYVDCQALLAELDLTADDLAGLELAQRKALVSRAVKQIRVRNHPDLLKNLADKAQANQRTLRVAAVEHLVLSHDFRLVFARKDDGDPVVVDEGVGDAQQEPVSSPQADNPPTTGPPGQSFYTGLLPDSYYEADNPPTTGPHPGGGVGRISDEGSIMERPTSLERTLFANSVVSYNFWTDSIESEDREQLRLAVSDLDEVTAKKEKLRVRAPVAALIAVALLIVTFVHGYKDVGMDTDDKYAQVMALIFLTLLFGAYSIGALLRCATLIDFLKHPVSPRLRANSEARFNAWLANLETTDPDHHGEIVEWFRQVELARQQEEARLERERQEARRREALAAAVSHVATLDRQRMDEQHRTEQAEREAYFATEKAKRHARYDESDRLRAEQAQRYENERAQAAYQASQNARTCVFCDRPGMHHTASGWMCGIHLHHLM